MHSPRSFAYFNSITQKKTQQGMGPRVSSLTSCSGQYRATPSILIYLFTLSSAVVSPIGSTTTAEGTPNSHILDEMALSQKKERKRERGKGRKGERKREKKKREKRDKKRERERERERKREREKERKRERVMGETTLKACTNLDTRKKKRRYQSASGFVSITTPTSGSPSPTRPSQNGEY